MKIFTIDPEGRFEGVSKLVYEINADGHPQLIRVIDQTGNDVFDDYKKNSHPDIWADMVTWHLSNHPKKFIEE